jgi:hypothetical protein
VSCAVSVNPAAAELTTTTPARALAATGRDHRLDFWRGLCLVDMVLVHLVYEGVKMGSFLQGVFGEFTRFAAGGFIFLAGLGITYIFLPKARDDRKRWGTYQSLWRRSLYLLFVHYAASLSFIFIYPIRDFAGPYPKPLTYVRDVLMFREGSDLLIFYVIMVALAPAFLEIIRRGYWWAAALFSLSIFTFGQYHPYALSLPIQQNFMIVLWQMIFVMGMLAGAALPKWDGLTLRGKLTLAGVGCAVLALVEAVQNTAWGWSLGISFVKNPLSWGEAVRYLSLMTTIMMLTDLCWRWIAGGNVAGFLTRLGRRSLAVYVAHVWVVAVTVAVANRTSWLGAWQIVLVVAAVAMLWSWTCVLDSLSEAPKKRGDEPALGQAFWRLSGAAVAGVCICFALYAAAPILGHRDPVARILAKMTPPSNLTAYVADAADADAYDPDPGPLPDMPYDDVTPEDRQV